MSGFTVEKAENGIVAIKRDGETVHLMPEDVFIAIRNPPVPSNHMDVGEFVDDGYLHEVNRQFLHPLGLALGIVADTDDETGEQIGPWRVHGIWDYRDDPEGMAFDDDTFGVAKAAHIAELAEARRPAREAALGYWVQPIKPPGASNG